MPLEYQLPNDAVIQKMLIEKLAQIGIDVYLFYPKKLTDFPLIIIQPPLFKPKYMGAAWVIGVTIEVWGNNHFDPTGAKKETADYYFELMQKMQELNFTQTNRLPAQNDEATGKIRYCGYFEVRWNATNNTLERNN